MPRLLRNTAAALHRTTAKETGTAASRRCRCFAPDSGQRKRTLCNTLDRLAVHRQVGTAAASSSCRRFAPDSGQREKALWTVSLSKRCVLVGGRYRGCFVKLPPPPKPKFEPEKKKEEEPAKKDAATKADDSSLDADKAESRASVLAVSGFTVAAQLALLLV